MRKKAGTELSHEFKIAETETFQKALSKPEYKKLYRKIVDYVYPQLRKNPFYGLNIKKLKGDLEDLYRYRIGSNRLFYEVDRQQVIVFMITLKKRKHAYR
jgi:mRNA interferase RelE/StbE